MKFKKCCLGKVDWDAISRGGGDRFHHLSVRGRNLAFFELICEILLLDSDRNVRPLESYKKAFTAQAVRRLGEGIVRIWPPDLDIESALRSDTRGVSGLYVGDYDRDQLLRGVVRHSTYASKLLVCDPFIYPLSVRPEYSPITSPEQHRAQTLQNVNTWIELMPWIQAGLVEVIRTPCDFDHRLKWEAMKEQEEKFERVPELKEAARVSVDEMMKRHSAQWKFRSLLLSMPDGALLQKFEVLRSEDDGVSKEALLDYVKHLRSRDPDFLAPFGEDLSGQLHMVTSGAAYNIACLTAEMTGSYLITDLHVRWREIELDRTGRTPETEAWSPFAQAMQEATLHYLDDVSLSDALALRRDGRLEELRVFLRRVWAQACDTNSYARVNGQLLAEELATEIAKADDEWKQIDRDLLRNAGSIGAGIATAATMFGSGQGGFVAAAAVIGGLPLLAASAWQRRGFARRFPAAFFLRLAARR